ncbi:MAG: cell division protein ZipA [Halofilum sp. (in: g-proteobacteria)]|nr:cell division protein ZipA [Halofilum sp. (in: g-proteobacteria)]
MDALRWILLLIGLVLIAGIYWLGRRKGQDEHREGLFERARRAARDDRVSDEPASGAVEPDLDIDDIDVHGFDVEDRPGEAREAPDRSMPADDPDARDAYGTEPETPAPAPHAPADRPAAPADVASRSPIDSGPTEPPPEERSGAGWSADVPSGPKADRQPESDHGPEPASADPASEPDHEPGFGQDPEPEPVVARPETHGDAPDSAETAASGRAATDTSPAATSDRGREEREPPGRGQEKGAEERVVVLHVVAPEGERLVGARLREALEASGMRHGAYSIFHASDSEGSIVFSAANAVEPGTFDRSTMDTLTTPGIALFMQVPGAQSAETVFDRMLSTARSVADTLEAHVLDERHSTLTRQTEQHLREELRLLDRRTGSLQR